MKFFIQNLTIRKRFFFLALFPFLLGVAAAFILYYNNDQHRFSRISDEVFYSELISNTLNMHYTIAYPEDYQLEYQPRLAIYSPGTATQDTEELNRLTARLQDISPGHLTEDDAYTYRLLTTYLDNQLTGNRLYIYEEPFSPSSGVQSSLPVLLADYTFRSAADVEDYLAILDQIDDFLSGLIVFEGEKADAGLFMSDTAAQKVVEQCDKIMNQEELQAGTHLLQATFQERVEALTAQGVITAGQKDDYIQRNHELLTTVVQPAYAKAGDELYLLLGSGNNDKGLYYYPEGQEYYQFLLRNSVGSYRSIDSIKKLLFQDFQDNYARLIQLSASFTGLPQGLQSDYLTLPVSDPAEILKYLQHNISDNYPPFPTVPGTDTPVCTVKNVSPNMEPYSSPAYYLTPPIDRYSENTIYINQRNNTDNLTLFTTLAHEGYPGHLYQTVYHRYSMEQNDGNLLRHVLHYGGYLEGWAVYAEMDSYRYAKQLMAESIPETAYIYDFYRLNHSLQLCLYSLLDIAIHYDGADLNQVRKILATIGIENEENVLRIYEYIVNEPTNYPKYYLGYLEILELKKEAQILWGVQYSDYEFNRFFLDAGPSDFTNLERLLREENLSRE